MSSGPNGIKGLFCLRLTDDIHAALRQQAQAQNQSMSEIVRVILYQAIYGYAPSETDGYAQGRKIAYQTAMRLVKDAIDAMPPLEVAVAYSAQGNPDPHRNIND